MCGFVFFACKSSDSRAGRQELLEQARKNSTQAMQSDGKPFYVQRMEDDVSDLKSTISEYLEENEGYDENLDIYLQDILETDEKDIKDTFFVSDFERYINENLSDDEQGNSNEDLGEDLSEFIEYEKQIDCQEYVFSKDVDRENNEESESVSSFVADQKSCYFKTSQESVIEVSQEGNKDQAKEKEFRIPRKPVFLEEPRYMPQSHIHGFFLNGMPIDLMPEQCQVETSEQEGSNKKIETWNLNPHSGKGNFVSFGNDSAQDGFYRCHLPPYSFSGDEDKTYKDNVIGFAADGIPILFMTSEDQNIQPSYRLKDSNLSGKYREDYEYVEGLGDLDECNGMEKDGSYAYYMTNEFPYLMNCFKAKVHNSFRKKSKNFGKEEEENGVGLLISLVGIKTLSAVIQYGAGRSEYKAIKSELSGLNEADLTKITKAGPIDMLYIDVENQNLKTRLRSYRYSFMGVALSMMSVPIVLYFTFKDDKSKDDEIAQASVALLVGLLNAPAIFQLIRQAGQYSPVVKDYKKYMSYLGNSTTSLTELELEILNRELENLKNSKKYKFPTSSTLEGLDDNQKKILADQAASQKNAVQPAYDKAGRKIQSLVGSKNISNPTRQILTGGVIGAIGLGLGGLTLNAMVENINDITRLSLVQEGDDPRPSFYEKLGKIAVRIKRNKEEFKKLAL